MRMKPFNTASLLNASEADSFLGNRRGLLESRKHISEADLVDFHHHFETHLAKRTTKHDLRRKAGV